MKKRIYGKVISNTKVSSNLFELKVNVGEMVDYCQCGQFVSIYVNDSSKILPRPISISEIDKQNQILTFVIQVVGEGTIQLQNVNEDEQLAMLIPLGNGYNLEKAKGIVYLIGGGVGIPPLVGTYKNLKQKGIDVKVILGFRDETFLLDKFENEDLYICTDSGSAGFKGNVVQQLQQLDKPNIIYSCGPKPMLKGLAEYGKQNNVLTYISMEERMACSVGVCLGCVINILDENGEKVSKKVCSDGPVFRGDEVVFE